MGALGWGRGGGRGGVGGGGGGRDHNAEEQSGSSSVTITCEKQLLSASGRYCWAGCPHLCMGISL